MKSADPASPSGTTPTRILIADDSADIRTAFRIVLDAQPDMRVVGEAADGDAALGLVRRIRPDVVLADIRMPKIDGLELTAQLAGPTGPRVIVVTTFDLDEYVYSALGAGACGFLLKRSEPTLLVEAVRAAMAGDTLISPQVTVRLLRQITRSRPTVAPPTEPLTDRELEVAGLVARGFSNAEIGAELFISSGTAKNHIATIARKLAVRNRVGIAGWAWATGLVAAEE